jgi:hypothetical protein
MSSNALYRLVTLVAVVVPANFMGAEPLKKFSLVYNVNNAGYVDVCGCKKKEVRQGSLTRRASFLKQLRATGRQICLLDGGSSLFSIKDNLKDSEREEAIKKATLIVEGYNRIGYQALAIGPFDLAAGLDTLKDLEKRAEFAFLSANLVDKATDKLHFKPYVILETGGVRLGVIGLTLSTLNKKYLEKVAPNLKVLDPFKAAKKCVDDLRGKVDLIVALSHLRQENNIKLVSELKELEILLDPYIEYGNHHTWIKEHEWLDFKDETVFLRTDGQGARLGILDIEVATPRVKLADAARIAELEAAVESKEATPEEIKELELSRGKNILHFQRISIEPHHRTDPEIDLMVAEWKKGIDPSRVAHLEAQLPNKEDFVTVAKCQTCHEKQYDNWKTTKHSHAMASLTETGDEHRYDCVGCHSLGYGEAYLDTSKMGSFAEVQCESCHGTNPKHMEAPKEHTFGRVKRSDCLVCHNKEQTRTNFHFAEAKAQIQCPKS